MSQHGKHPTQVIAAARMVLGFGPSESFNEEMLNDRFIDMMYSWGGDQLFAALIQETYQFLLKSAVDRRFRDHYEQKEKMALLLFGFVPDTCIYRSEVISRYNELRRVWRDDEELMSVINASYKLIMKFAIRDYSEPFEEGLFGHDGEKIVVSPFVPDPDPTKLDSRLPEF